ncbi:MAG: hypothetical protein AAFO69_16775, partial [Bacteroidota bacterium]
FTSSLISNAKKEVFDNFLQDNPDCKYLMTDIDIPGKCDWLNFDITEDQKLFLFRQGVKAGLEFLADFNWQDYKRVRNDGLNHRFCNPYISTRVAS